MSLPQELTEQIHVYVWSGFYTEEEIHERIEEMVEEEWFDSEETDAAAVDEGVMRDAIAAEFQKKAHDRSGHHRHMKMPILKPGPWQQLEVESVGAVSS